MTSPHLAFSIPHLEFLPDCSLAAWMNGSKLNAVSIITRDPIGRRMALYALICFLFPIWTLAVKFINPICWSWAEYRLTGQFPPPPILWDFWPVAHIWMGVWLLMRHRHAWLCAVTISAVEIVVIAVKFTGFFLHPDAPRTTAPQAFDFFMTNNWFVNKAFLVLFFVIVLTDLLRPATKRYLQQPMEAV